MSYHLKMSGFYSGKGKGKRTVSDEENSVESKPSPDRDSEEEFLLKRAKYLSLQSDKVGEPSKNPVNSPQKEEFEMISYYTKQWKILSDKFNRLARDHNILQDKLYKRKINTSDSEKLKQFKEEIDLLRVERDKFKSILLNYGIDPSQQFYEDSDGDFSQFSGYSSDKSEDRPNKRIKFLDPNNNNKNLTGLFPIYNIVSHFTFILRFLSSIVSMVLLLVIHLNILPNFNFIFDISLVELIGFYLLVNLIKLMYKMYSTILTVYNSYLNKDYLIIYTNIVFSIIILLLYFGTNMDVYIFYI